MPNGEISTASIVQNAFQSGKEIYIPYTYKMSRPRENWPTQIMDMVRLESGRDYASLEPDKWGIPTPTQDSISKRRNCFGGLGKSEDDQHECQITERELDVIIMPGMAFDRGLERVGHGKGYYDFFLQRYLHHTQKAKMKMPFLGKKKHRRFYWYYDKWRSGTNVV
jgi:5-formyltetrahydrofolate cyclo-ligase